jgi:TPR repeat protein
MLFGRDGIQQSFEKAFELYQKAAESGLVDAYYDLGVCYRRGEGVEMDLEKAKECYQKAIDHGNDNALVNIREFDISNQKRVS